MSEPLLQVSGLSKYFPLKGGGIGSGERLLRAVHNVSFSISAGETLGMVGESGCGKSTTGRLVLRLIEPSAGSIKLGGQELNGLRSRQLKPYRRRMQIVFQDPLGSLNPRLNVGKILAEPLHVHGIPRREHSQRIRELLTDVELPQNVVQRYPHEFSGGQRQRIAIARALALSPELIIADEPVSALDASIQSQVLMLLGRLQQEHGLSYLFISHDLAVVRFLCHRVAVMYLGEIVESGPVAAVYETPAHPYTKALLKAIPRAEPDAPEIEPLGGTLPDPANPPPGCAFAGRCSVALPKCRIEAPPEYTLADGHTSRCWLHEGSSLADSNEIPVEAS